ncbi:hypothetical protein AYJ57_22610 (plasmid) [Salipiger sp. CCB-MM3]|uniref:glycosyltransferase family 4 protein n=1 Tax=Salipiger sp. CCB-MM3 TaxID=1792508 RepID=UPI00080AA51E|nr:glycosyltransferase family 1 protein [Salipiger sp. CCB-MM3]ANT63270.1 hypothetical protein AYJ57_22610 [Salipiger sp. CCB-MM3]
MAVTAKKRRLVVNGRFLGGPETAVNAVARELTAALAKVEGNWDVKVLVPPALIGAGDGSAVEPYGTRDGILWEQMDLPRARRDAVVAGFFNTVPLRGQGYVTMLHDAHVFTTPESYGKATGTWRRLLSRRAASPRNYILTVSQHSKDELLRLGLGTEDRMGVVPNGLGEVGRVRPDHAILGRLGLGQGSYCIALANLLPHKNIPLLLKAFADPALADLKLVLIGKAGAEAFAEAGYPPGENVVFPGFVSDAELAALYSEALAVCVPSTEEGFGLPALEGMAHGAPALVADRGALPEVVGEAGVMLPANDPGAWVAAISGLASAPGRRATLSEAGRARASIFTWENAAHAALGHLDRWFPA